MVDGEFLFLLIFFFRTIKSWQYHSSPPNLFIFFKQIYETQTPMSMKGAWERLSMGMKSGLSVRNRENGHEGRKHTWLLAQHRWLGRRTSESGKVRLAARKGRLQDIHSQCLPWMTAGTVVPLAGKQNTEE